VDDGMEEEVERVGGTRRAMEYSIKEGNPI
jgi:hypothetical protein